MDPSLETLPAVAGAKGKPPSDAREQWIEPETLAALVLASEEAYESQGHAVPNYQVQVFVSPEAVALYRDWSLGSSMPSGIWIVARHSWRGSAVTAPSSNVTPPSYVMHRTPSGWTFGAIDPKGRRIPADQGVCQDCHTQAKADSIFGPPKVLAPIQP